MSFKDLKKNSSSGSLTEKLLKAVENLSSEGNSTDSDEGYWKLKVDKAQNGYAVIRFLPAPDDQTPFVRLWRHAFQHVDKGPWYIENCLTTLSGTNDPVCDYNKDLYAENTKESKALASKQKRKLSYISNIYVVKDPGNPENEGKVFLFKYGKMIYEQVKAAAQPQFEDEVAFNPFDMWKGADFKLKARNKDGYRNYDLSSFSEPAPLLNGEDEALEAVYDNLYDISKLVAEDQFKPYDVLKARLRLVLASGGLLKTKRNIDFGNDENEVDFKHLLMLMKNRY